MYLIYHPPFGYGRLGNAIFRYFATIVLHYEYNIEYSNEIDNINYTNLIKINDNIFEQIVVNNKNNEKNIKINSNILLNDFYQFDIYLEYKNKIIRYMEKYKDIHLIKSDQNDNYNIYKISSLINNNKVNIYNYILHVRLEDFINIGTYIKVEYILKLLENIKKDNNIDNIGIVVKKISNEFEEKYINEITTWLNMNNIKYNIESNDVITDFQIMKQSNILICSKSTLSWCATIISTNIQKCYFPKYRKSRYQLFNRPHINTIYYDCGE